MSTRTPQEEVEARRKADGGLRQNGEVIPIPGDRGASIATTVSATLAKYLPVDWLFSSYLIITALIMGFGGRGVGPRWSIVLLHVVLLVGTYWMVSTLDHRRTGVARFIRLLYLPAIMTFFYRESASFLQIFHSGWYDAALISLERSILGVSPTLWLEPWTHPALNELLMMGYFSYYFLVAAASLVYFFTRRDAETAHLVFTLGLAFFISYFGFMLYPVHGPRFEFAQLYAGPLEGFLFVPLVAKIMEVAAIHGGCMPSSHVAAGVIAFAYLRRANKRLGQVLLPLVVLLCLGTVYGRFHYISDVIVGLAVAGFSWWIATKCQKSNSHMRWSST